jgi:hypothetical protein
MPIALAFVDATSSVAVADVPTLIVYVVVALDHAVVTNNSMSMMVLFAGITMLVAAAVVDCVIAAD